MPDQATILRHRRQWSLGVHLRGQEGLSSRTSGPGSNAAGFARGAGRALGDQVFPAGATATGPARRRSAGKASFIIAAAISRRPTITLSAPCWRRWSASASVSARAQMCRSGLALRPRATTWPASKTLGSATSRSAARGDAGGLQHRGVGGVAGDRLDALRRGAAPCCSCAVVDDQERARRRRAAPRPGAGRRSRSRRRWCGRTGRSATSASSSAAGRPTPAAAARAARAAGRGRRRAAG